jgi:predicted Rossmann fold flavoprotein
MEHEVYGDVLFTKYGVSGFAILDISQMAAQSLSFYQDVKLSLNFFPKISRADLTSQIQTLCKALPNILIKDVLIGMMPNKMPSVLCEICKISSDTKAQDVNPKQIKALAFQLSQWKINITDTQGFKHAEVSGGGIRTAEVNNRSYESKKCKGLYFAGEVLDIVGHRGGFNLQYAWASGYAVGQAITKK